MDREKMCIAFLIRFIVNDWIQDTMSNAVIFHTYVYTHNAKQPEYKNIFVNFIMASGKENFASFSRGNSYANPEEKISALW